MNGLLTYRGNRFDPVGDDADSFFAAFALDFAFEFVCELLFGFLELL